MKPHPRIRKTVKWGGAVVTVLLVVVWIGSGWMSVGRYGVQYHGAIGGGCIVLQWPNGAQSDNSAPGWVCVYHPWRVSTWWLFLNDKGAWIRLYVPIWLIAVVPVLLAGSAWRLDMLARRRARVGQCPKCSYDLTGLAAGAACPECGTGRISI